MENQLLGKLGVLPLEVRSKIWQHFIPAECPPLSSPPYPSWPYRSRQDQTEITDSWVDFIQLRSICRGFRQDSAFTLFGVPGRRFHVSVRGPEVEFEGVVGGSNLSLFRKILPLIKDLRITIDLPIGGLCFDPHQDQTLKEISNIATIIGETPCQIERTINVHTQLESDDPPANAPPIAHMMWGAMLNNADCIVLSATKTWTNSLAREVGPKLAKFAGPLHMAAARWPSTHCPRRPCVHQSLDTKIEYCGWEKVVNHYLKTLEGNVRGDN